MSVVLSVIFIVILPLLAVLMFEFATAKTGTLLMSTGEEVNPVELPGKISSENKVFPLSAICILMEVPAGTFESKVIFCH